MHRPGALLILFTLLLGAATGAEDMLEEEDDVPLDFLTFSSGNDIEIDFGYEMIEYLHTERINCEINNKKEDLKFTGKLDHLRRYFKQTKMTVEQHEFEVLAKENSRDILKNFHKAFKDIETSHLRKLSRTQSQCNQNIQMFVDGRLEMVMNYARDLLQKDKIQFNKLVRDMINYQNQLETGLNRCMALMEGNKQVDDVRLNYYDLCYGNEVLILIKFITQFTTLTDQLVHKPSRGSEIKLLTTPGLEDDEDESTSGSGDEKTTTNTENTPKQQGKVYSKTSETKSLPKSDSTPHDKVDVEPVITPKSTPTPQDKLSTTIPDKPVTKPLPKSKVPTTLAGTSKPTVSSIKQKDTVSETTKPKATTKLEMPKTDKSNHPKGQTVTTEPKATKDSSIAEESFAAIKRMQEAVTSVVKVPKERLSSQVENKELSIDLDLPGVDADLDVEIGPNGVEIDAQGADEEVLVFDDFPTTAASVTTQETHHAHQKYNFTTMFFIYFFSTLGILLALALLVLIVIIVRVRFSNPKALKSDTIPILSEEDKIAVMKKSGYVNPTYKFFDEVKEV